jgi:hypothetical protein
MAETRFARTECIGHAPAVGDVADGSSEHRRPVCGDADDRGFDGELGPVRAHRLDLDPPAE